MNKLKIKLLVCVKFFMGGYSGGGSNNLTPPHVGVTFALPLKAAGVSARAVIGREIADDVLYHFSCVLLVLIHTFIFSVKF